PHSAQPALSVASARAMSPSDKMPTRRSWRFSTRHSAHLVLGHFLRNLVQVVILETIFHAIAHNLADSRVWTLAGGYGANGDIAIGDHSRQPAVVANREHTGIDLRHHARRISDRLIRVCDSHLAAHGSADFHGILLYFDCASSNSRCSRRRKAFRRKGSLWNFGKRYRDALVLALSEHAQFDRGAGCCPAYFLHKVAVILDRLV